MLRVSILLILISGLLACSSMSNNRLPANLQGTELEVVKPVSFAPDAFGAIYQGGIQVSQRDLTIWNYYCDLTLKESRPSRWYLEEGRYSITRLKAYSRLCDWDGCDWVNEYTLNTISGPDALKMTCVRRYLFGEPGNWFYEILTPSQLNAILGDAIEVR